MRGITSEPSCKNRKLSFKEKWIAKSRRQKTTLWTVNSSPRKTSRGTCQKAHDQKIKDQKILDEKKEKHNGEPTNKGMTTLVCVSPKTTVLITAALPLAYLLFYAIMEKRHYSKELYNPSGDTCEHHLSWNEKLALMWQSLRGVVSFSVGLFVEVLVLGSMVTTLAFQNSPFDPRDHYVYYVLMVTMGASLVDRTSVFFLRVTRHVLLLSRKRGFYQEFSLFWEPFWLLRRGIVSFRTLASF
ncbi:battenin CLN3 protein [Desmophyllum pertusum]|uniref:Battenin CLN3 protein n=1 Tax=Desmophyllum pertusum TaxID=174260 RepID=A0A9W9YTA5_9CNID|nr:battenin CLN3 protein [Desmophyllum pertusum]